MKITLFYIFVAEIAFLFSVFALMHLVEGSVAFRDFSSCMSWKWTTVPPSCQSITYHFPPLVLTPTCFGFSCSLSHTLCIIIQLDSFVLRAIFSLLILKVIICILIRSFPTPVKK